MARKLTPRLPAGSLDWDALELPKHKRFQLVLEEKIRLGEWRPGDRLPTEKELMAQYELSYATVSRAVRELARAGLVRRTRKLGTFVSESPRNFLLPELSTSAANTIALFHGWQTTGFHPYFSALIQGLVTASGEHGMSLKLISAPRGNLDVGMHFREQHGICGFIATRVIKRDAAAALRQRIPMVLHATYWQDVPADRVGVDSNDVLRKVFRHFQRAGHERVAVITTREQPGLREVAGECFDCLPEEAPVQLFYTQDWSEHGVRQALQELLRLRPRPSAVYVGDDFLLMHLLRLLAKQGVAMPGELAVIGRGSPLSRHLVGESASMIEVDPLAIASASVRLLVEQVRSGRPPGKTILVKPRLVARSTG